MIRSREQCVGIVGVSGVRRGSREKEEQRPEPLPHTAFRLHSGGMHRNEFNLQ